MSLDEHSVSAASPAQAPKGGELWVLGCSATKTEDKGDLPALSRYDGPAFKVVRSYIRDHLWPTGLSIAVLSARHRLIGALTPLEHYDKRMTPESAAEMQHEVTEALEGVGRQHKRVRLVLGKDYLPAINTEFLRSRNIDPKVVPGGIGEKLHFISEGMTRLGRSRPRSERRLTKIARPRYFLPDWDDFLDVNFDFKKDKFSADHRDQREQKHSIELMRPQRLCDGVLVSLAQHMGSKGLLKRHGALTIDALAPRSVRSHFALRADQWAFGDCGAFSYVAAPEPTISVEKAVALYDLFEFDLGASVDHIPVPEYRDAEGNRIALSRPQREERVRITRRNAARFIEACWASRAQFTPVGVIQGLSPDDYAEQLKDYKAFGYDSVALGGLVPRSDDEIVEIVELVRSRLDRYFGGWSPWIHLFGVYRPNIQRKLRAMGVNSFDSATYFRKAWLRSDQNYLGTDGEWYAAIRVPPTSDPRTMKRLGATKLSTRKIKAMERAALRALRRFDAEELSASKALDTVIAYDALLLRNESSAEDLREKYLQTLEARPWKQCTCEVCTKLGINALVFRGLNRNKRRGAHNTLMLYRHVCNKSG
ncbi:MAG: tRNA-guanine transglycosylase DpdA [Planctomycetota bacterium]|nr:tRNA-guanine transglycosylase DpdA [Planctomycetota bacterium]